MGTIMGRIYWSLGNKKYESYTDFVREVTEYNNDISPGDHEWEPDKIVIDHPKIIVGYEALWKDEDDILEITIEGRNESAITMGEFLFTLTNESVDFFSESSFFFEGISRIKNDSPIPMYYILIGT